MARKEIERAVARTRAELGGKLAVDDVVRLLSLAKERIELPGAWSPRGIARLRDGSACTPEAEGAVAFCAAGALYATTLDEDNGIPLVAVRAGILFLETFTKQSLAAWNDSPERTQEDVLGLFERSMQAAQ